MERRDRSDDSKGEIRVGRGGGSSLSMESHAVSVLRNYETANSADTLGGTRTQAYQGNQWMSGRVAGADRRGGRGVTDSDLWE